MKPEVLICASFNLKLKCLKGVAKQLKNWPSCSTAFREDCILDDPSFPLLLLLYILVTLAAECSTVT